MTDGSGKGGGLGVDGLLLDMDGVLTVSFEPIPGAPQALRRLRDMGLPFRIMSNWTELSRAGLTERLGRAGFDVSIDEVFTASAATARYLRRSHPGARCFLLGVQGDVMADLTGIEWVHDRADVVVVAGADPAYTFDNLNLALRMLANGAALVSMHRNLTWMTAEGLSLDAGAYLLGLEAATGLRAVVTGKPAPEFFVAGLESLGLPAERVAMVGDDVENDVLAAQALGIHGVLVRTGKVTRETLDRASGTPDRVVDSVVDVPGLIGARTGTS